MALTFKDLVPLSVSEIGAELAAARDLLNKNSSDFILDLRTTRHHINAIEAGELRIFYGAPFYIDLMRRYAKALNFSDNNILLFEKRALGFSEAKPERNFLKSGKNDSNYPLNKIRKKVFTNVKLKRKKISLNPVESKALKENNDKILLLLVIVTIMVSGFFLIFPEDNSNINTFPKSVNKINNGSKDSEKKIIINSEQDKKKLQKNSSSINFKVVVSSELEKVNVKKKKNEISLFISSEEAIKNETNIPDDFPVVEESQVGLKKNQGELETRIPNISLFANERTWYWIRYYDDSIKEFMVDANTKTDIPNYPIYLVIGNPEKVKLSINGSEVSVERNDPGRNIARFTRTELRAMSK